MEDFELGCSGGARMSRHEALTATATLAPGVPALHILVAAIVLACAGACDWIPGPRGLDVGLVGHATDAGVLQEADQGVDPVPDDRGREGSPESDVRTGAGAWDAASDADGTRSPPPLADVVATVRGAGPFTRAGFVASGGRDLTGDGRTDLVVGWAGAGGEFGLSLFTLPLPVQASTSDGVEIGRVDASHGVRAAGDAEVGQDVTGDDVDDLVVSLLWTDGAVTRAAACVVAIAQSADGADRSSEPSADVPAFGSLSCSALLLGPPTDAASVAVGIAGDLNADGTPDLVFSDPGDDALAEDGGAVWVAYGPLSGLLYAEDCLTRRAASVLRGDIEGARAGYALDAAGDADGDGYGDLIVGSDRESGVAWWVPGPPHRTEVIGERGTAWLGDAGWFGSSVAFLRGPGLHTPETVVLAAPLGVPPSVAIALTGAAGEPVATLRRAEISGAGSLFGASLYSGGDSDGDGHSELLVGAPGFSDPGGTVAGAVAVWEPSSHAAPRWIMMGSQENEGLGTRVLAIGDVNGDGIADWGAAAPYWDGHATDQGRLVFWSSTPMPPEG